MIGDFGAAFHPCEMRKYYGPQKLGEVGTLVYMAPEIWKRALTPDEMKYSDILPKAMMRSTEAKHLNKTRHI